MSPSQTSVMVIDDSAVVRGVIGRYLDAEPDLRVASSSSSAAMALTELKRGAVDVILLDLEMPEMDGLTALPHLIRAAPGAKVLIVSSQTRRQAELGFKALQMGAADCLPKPESGSLVGADAFRRDLLAKIRAVARRPSPPPPAPVERAVATPRRASAPRVLAIGGSTGAPPLLIEIFAGLGPALKLPILVAQHMPPTFTAILAEQIGRAARRPAAEGVDGEPVAPGRVYVAPGGLHMTVALQEGGPVIRLSRDPPEHFCRPAVDPLLRSVAQTYGPGAMAVILTGMGADGAAGCEVVAQAGGRFIVQDEATSAVWGMPGAAARTGLAERILPAGEIAPYLMQAAGAAR